MPFTLFPSSPVMLTHFSQLTGLLVASAGLYAIYILPRIVPPLRAIVGLPGI